MSSLPDGPRRTPYIAGCRAEARPQTQVIAADRMITWYPDAIVRGDHFSPHPSRADMSNDPKISVEVDPTRELTRVLFDALSLSNIERTNDGQIAHICVIARDSAGELVGGTYGEVYWGWLHVLVLWVNPTQRRRGLGGQLLARAEAEALSKGCRAVWLDTFTFQGQHFYLRAGYEIFGTLEQYPDGHSRHFLRKYLQSATD